MLLGFLPTWKVKLQSGGEIPETPLCVKAECSRNIAEAESRRLVRFRAVEAGLEFQAQLQHLKVLWLRLQNDTFNQKLINIVLFVQLVCPTK